jgi:hypothetical protein
VTVGDFNGDGKLDVVVGQHIFYMAIPHPSTAGNLIVFLGKGGGTFQQKTSTPTGRFPPDYLIVRELNGDHKLDLAIGSSGGTQIFLGKGDGTFQDHGMCCEFPAGSGDFNGDGIPDMLNPYNAGMNVFLGKGDGSFTNAIHSPSGCSGYGLLLADFNKDGKTDLACGWGDDVRVSLSNGDGTFRATAQFHNRRLLAIGDFNGDGREDVALATPIASTVIDIMLGNGDGTFQGHGQNSDNRVR